jgi:hypothetical protein
METKILQAFTDHGIAGILLGALLFVVWQFFKFLQKLHEDNRKDRDLDRKARKEDQDKFLATQKENNDKFLAALDELREAFKCEMRNGNR